MKTRSLDFKTHHWIWLVEQEQETNSHDSPGIDFDSVFDDAEHALEAARFAPDHLLPNFYTRTTSIKEPKS